MQVEEVTMTSFAVLQVTWLPERGRKLIERLHPSHVIVRWVDQHDSYYLFSAREALVLLGQAPRHASLQEALRLNEREATPLVDSSSDAEQAPDQCIVLEEGQVIGFFDVTIPPGEIASKGRRNRPTTEKQFSEINSVVAAFPEQVLLDSLFSLRVALTSEPGAAQNARLAQPLPVGTVVHIVVLPRHGLVLEGKGEGTLVIDQPQGETSPLQFTLRSVALGLAELDILAFRRARLLGRLPVSIRVVAAATESPPPPRRQERVLDPVRSQSPDLSLVILEQRQYDETALSFLLTAADPALQFNLKTFGPTRLRGDPRDYFQDFFREIERLPLRDEQVRQIAERRLASKGMHLFTTTFPEDLQRALWALRDRIQSIQIQSQEPWIPWELCKLCGPGSDTGISSEGPFLAEGFVIARWVPGIALRPLLSLNNLAVVAPEDSGLSMAQAELAHLRSLAKGTRRVTRIPAQSLEVQAALATGSYDGWHFTGHGIFQDANPDRSAILLEQQQKLTPEDLCGVVSNLGMATPLVFLNACQVGRSATALTEMGGWARRFLRAGAGAFIGPYWSVYDGAAYEFAKEFYDRLLSGIPIGEAAQQARLAIKSGGNPTWLAYTIFADPLARIPMSTSFSES